MINMLNEFENYVNTCGIQSYSQLNQDLLVLFLLKNKKNGIFVDFGATNGITINNTYLLEKDFGWSGIVAEPNKQYTTELQNNRKCSIDNRAVYYKTGDSVILHVPTKDNLTDLATLENYIYTDHWGHTRMSEQYEQYLVDTISLDDLLTQHNINSDIDYLSIDTEGSEYDILKAYSFNRKIKIITVEHNGNKYRNDIFNLLTRNHGYSRILTDISKYDDWYVLL